LRRGGLDGQFDGRDERRLEQALTDADAARRDAQQWHETALAAAANELAERQAHFDRELSRTTAIVMVCAVAIDIEMVPIGMVRLPPAALMRSAYGARG
jgi:anti-sigma factor RsiW